MSGFRLDELPLAEIDCLVRIEIAIDARAAEALIIARGMQQQRDDVLALLDETPPKQLPEDLRSLRKNSK